MNFVTRSYYSMNFAKMFTLQINAKNMTFAFLYNIFIQSNLKSLKSSGISICGTFSFPFVFVIIIFAIFKDRVFTSLFIDADVYIRNYKLYLD